MLSTWPKKIFPSMDRVLLPLLERRLQQSPQTQAFRTQPEISSSQEMLQQLTLKITVQFSVAQESHSATCSLMLPRQTASTNTLVSRLCCGRWMLQTLPWRYIVN